MEEQHPRKLRLTPLSVSDRSRRLSPRCRWAGNWMPNIDYLCGHAPAGSPVSEATLAAQRRDLTIPSERNEKQHLVLLLPGLFAEPVSIVSHCGDLTTPGHLTRGWTSHLSRPKTPRLADAPGSFL
jgi:hypothetical protein